MTTPRNPDGGLADSTGPEPAPAGPDAHGIGAVAHAHPTAIRLLVQVLLVSLAVLLYFGVRGLTQGSVVAAERHALQLLDLERALHLDWEDGLQDAILGRDWLVTLANWVYIYGHWPVVIATLVWLYVRHPPEYHQLRDAMFISGLIGIVIFMSYPVSPPRLVAELGLNDTILDRSSSYRALQPPGLLNKYAAMPSLHFGWNLLVGMTLYRVTTRRALKAFAVISPIAMAWAVVATANHYVLDVVVGGIVALAGLVLVPHVRRVLRGVRDRLRPRHT